MDNEPKVGIIINSYNHERFCKDSIMSALTQTYTNKWIYFYDNNSTDRTREMAYDFQKKHSMDVFMLDKPIAPGVTPIGIARYYAIQTALYKRKDLDYIAIMDADDYWAENKIEKQVAKLLQYAPSPKICFSDCYYLFWKGDPGFMEFPIFIEPTETKEIRGKFHDRYPPFPFFDPFWHMLTDYNYMPCPTLMFEVKAFQECVGNPMHYTSAHDYDWLLKILSRYNSVAYCDEPLAYYRIHAGQISQQTPARCTAEEIDVVKRAMFFKGLNTWQRLLVYKHIVYLYMKLFYKEVTGFKYAMRQEKKVKVI